ncbi:phosphoenolpyruvate--protein phosphotransferase [Puniceicoccus vermicola]|uniref:Phosphoenolpyruvate-protein phosphotransferase n=1 Tax=Puniceicoccus vermicola TaxID=388746 RepID=A0A7X1E5Q9_9BACT|nr:phosphoenolpyruvate--protein phosphotransferase [Puniceicoccus vermicola]
MSEENKEIILNGIPAAPGVVHGPAFVFQHQEVDVPVYRVPESKLENEKDRFEKALLQTRSQILRVRQEIARKIGESEAQIFDAHLLVLEDKALIDETISAVEDSGNNIEHCFALVARRYIDFFDSMEDEYLRERVADIRDVSKRVLSNLLGETSLGSMGTDALSEPHILVSNSINVSDVAQIKRERILGFVSESGGRTSHAVIMARSMKVPAVVGLENASELIEISDTVIVDGYDGLVIVNPTVDSLYRYGQISEKRDTIRKIYESKVALPSETVDGSKVKIMANIEEAGEIPSVLESRAEGVGLFRTEGIVLRERQALASEDLQFDQYQRVVEQLAPLPVVIRTLDIGGDKELPGNLFGREQNPFMGFRAIRYCLKNPEIFKEQLKAVLRAATYGKARLMYPMISGVRELLEANQLLEECKLELKERGEAYSEDIEVGSMIEIPSAAYTADVIAENCSFLSIGTNDLIQYMLAVDRVNDSIAHLYDPSHPGVLRTIKAVIDMAHEKNTPVAVCGEMASDPVYVPLLVGMGADELSMSPSLIPEVKFMIRHISMGSARDLTEEILSLKRPRQIFRRLREFYRGVMKDAVGEDFLP